MQHTAAYIGSEVKHFACPGLREGTWAVIRQRFPGDPGYAVADGLAREVAETEADRLNAEPS